MQIILYFSYSIATSRQKSTINTHKHVFGLIMNTTIESTLIIPPIHHSSNRRLRMNNPKKGLEWFNSHLQPWPKNKNNNTENFFKTLISKNYNIPFILEIPYNSASEHIPFFFLSLISPKMYVAQNDLLDYKVRISNPRITSIIYSFCSTLIIP